MADEAEDVLELDAELEADDEGQQAEEQTGEEDDEDVVLFAEEGAAPAPEGETSTIREMRQKLREAQREAAELRKQVKPQVVEIGPKPTLESCGYDEEVFEAEHDAWKARKAEAERAEQEAEARRKAEADKWAERVQTYQANKQSLRVKDYDDAEEEVFAALPEPIQALIMLTEKPAVLVYGLAKNPAKLEQLSKLDPARAAMMIGKLEDKFTVTTRSKAPQPDTPLRGSASLGGPDKELARLEKEAERTGDRTALIRYRKKLAERAN